MEIIQRKPFDPRVFLGVANVREGRTTAAYKRNETVFAQGDSANAIYHLQKGKVKLTVVSNSGKEAVVAILGTGNFFGEGCLARQLLRMSTATAIDKCSIMRLEKAQMMRVLHEEPAFSEMFVAHLLIRSIRVEEDLVDQLFNSSEKRLARVLLLLANFGKEGQPEQDHPGDAGGDGRHHPVASQFLHEQVSQTGIHRLHRQ